MRLERRIITAELRADEDGGRLVGYPAVFGQLSEQLGYFREKIRPGAFAKTIQEADVRALWNHDANYVLGRTSNGTLKLTEDEHGLRAEIEPPDTTWANDLRASIKRGDIDKLSFGFEAVRDEWNDDRTERELVEVRLYDVSPVTFPAYPQTEVSLRNLLNYPDAPPEGGHPSGEEGADDDRPDPQARLAHRRRKLELLDLER